MRLLLRGPLAASTGYGGDVIGLCEALLDHGVDVALWPLSVTPGLPPGVARLLERPLDPPYDVVVWYCDPAALTPWALPGWGRTVLGWTMWERTPLTTKSLLFFDRHLPDHADGRIWSKPARPPQRKTWCDALVVTCPMNIDAFGALDPHIPLEVIAPGVNPDDWPYVDRRGRTGPVRFGYEGALCGRKDPWTLLAAFDLVRRHHPDSLLELRDSSGSLHPAICDTRPGVTIHHGHWSRKRLAEWYASLDVYVSTSRGEGMGKPAVQAMCTGAPMVGAAWGGHAHFLLSDTGWPVDFELAESPSEAGTRDAAMTAADVAEAMCAAIEDPAGRWERGAAGAALVRLSLTWERAAARLLQIAADYA
jgi:glycosyltransferase involved in cell wall biosynthesis